MSDGIDRDFFDAIMTEFKSRYGVEQKLDFTAGADARDRLRLQAPRPRPGRRLRRRPLRPGRRLHAQGAGVVGLGARRASTASTSASPRSGARRSSCSAWSSATSAASPGSGVTFTNNPLEPYSRQVRLFGDFAVRSQGEDLVGGLVFPLPISEAQRLGSPTYRGTEHSLERDFPEIYQAAPRGGARPRRRARVRPAGDRVHLRVAGGGRTSTSCRSAPWSRSRRRDAAYFDTTSPNYGPPVAVGMGVAGGAYSGRAAVNAEQIDQLLAESPDENIVLLRPDTVPEDIAMITRVSGILTARGGTTSHAAVTAKRLGKTAVVDCVDLEVIEREGIVRLAGQRAARRRLAVHRRPHGQHLPRAHPHDRAAAAVPAEARLAARADAAPAADAPPAVAHK